MGLTMLRLLLLPVFLWLILDAPHHPARMHTERWAALAIFAVMAVTDKLDGYLARRLNQVSKIGTLLDPLADKLLVACSVILLSFDWVADGRLSIPLPVVLSIYVGISGCGDWKRGATDDRRQSDHHPSVSRQGQYRFAAGFGADDAVVT